MSFVVACVATAYEYLPVMQQYLPDGWFKYAALMIIVVRIVNQSQDAKPSE